METEPVWQMWVVFAVVAGAIVAYARERVAMDLVSITVLVTLLIFFRIFPVPGTEGRNALEPGALLAGFANPALVAIICLLVVGQGLFHAGALEGPTRYLIVFGRRRPYAILVFSLLLAMAVSAFLNNTPVTVMFIPIVSALVLGMKQAPSKVMMPLSFLCVLGGMVTLIGSSTNLLVADASARLGVGTIGFFDFSVPGLILAAVGAVYVFTIMPRLLPRHEPLADTLTGSGRQFIAQITLGPGHSLVGATLDKNRLKELPDMVVRLIQRNEHAMFPPFEGVDLGEGDVVIVAATRDALTSALASKADLLHGMTSHGFRPGGEKDATAAKAPELTLVEAVIAPGSRLVGFTVEQLGFRHLTGCIVLGIQRRSRMIRAQMRHIRLEAGDVLLLLGGREQVQALRRSHDILLLEWSSREVPNVTNAHRARIVFASVVVAAAVGLLPIVTAAMTGAAAMVVTGCLTLRQAARAIDLRIYLLVGAALALGTALEASGGAHFLADAIVRLAAESGPAVVLSALFLLTAAMTNVLSNNATAILFAPVAAGAASELQVDPMVFLYAVIFAANCSFVTPVGYQTNLLVMGPGQYRFADFPRAGLPLLVLLWLTFSLFAPWYYDLG